MPLTRPVAMRCDGHASTGAGHVARCLPIAEAFRDAGVDCSFVGLYGGTAAWLIERRQFDTEAPGDGPCGVDLGTWGGAVVDLYADSPGEVCRLARDLPVATVGEATRCPDAGVWIDYHLGSVPGADARRLGGPAYAPVDSRYLAARRPRAEVRRILVTTGASTLFGDTPARLSAAATSAFPEAEVITQPPDGPALDLVSLVPTIDLAVAGAGVTTYELACAGVPLIAVALIENQRVVLAGVRESGIGLAADGIGSDPLPAVEEALRELQDPASRAALSARAMAVVDGEGANRIATALLRAWSPPVMSDGGR